MCSYAAAARISYVELHCHSAYSFLDGASQPEELVAAAIARGHAALALTDHDSLSGSMEFAQAAQLARACGRSTGRRSRSTTAATSRCSSATRPAGATSAGC